MRPIIVIATAWLLLILIAPLLTSIDPRQTNPSEILQSPRQNHIFGTDNLGRDVFSRTLHGGQRTLFISFTAALIAILPALLLALLNHISHPIFDKLTDILLNTWLAFPSLLIALVILTLLGRGFLPIAIATGLSQLPFFFQVSRGIFRQEEARPYVIAAKSLGASNWHIVTKHILPNARPTLGAYASITFAYCLINSAALSLLGLGGDPSIPDWGIMLASGRDAFRAAPWSAIAPGIAVSITIILMNKLADTFS